MKVVTKIETSDGCLHDHVRKAKSHAEKRYADALLRHGRALANQRYTEVTEYIDAHLEEFVELAALKQDRELEENAEED